MPLWSPQKAYADAYATAHEAGARGRPALDCPNAKGREVLEALFIMDGIDGNYTYWAQALEDQLEWLEPLHKGDPASVEGRRCRNQTVILSYLQKYVEEFLCFDDLSTCSTLGHDSQRALFERFFIRPIVGMGMRPCPEQDRAFWMQAVHADVLN